MGVAAQFGIKRAIVNLAAIGANTVVAAVAGKRIVVHSLAIISNSAVDVTVKSAATDISGMMQFGDPGGFVLSHCEDGYLSTARGEALVFSTAGLANSAGGFLTYTEQD